MPQNGKNGVKSRICYIYFIVKGNGLEMLLIDMSYKCGIIWDINYG